MASSFYRVGHSALVCRAKAGSLLWTDFSKSGNVALEIIGFPKINFFYILFAKEAFHDEHIRKVCLLRQYLRLH